MAVASCDIRIATVNRVAMLCADNFHVYILLYKLLSAEREGV